MSKIYKDLDETKDILHKNMETLLDRGEKLDDLVDKSEGLSMSSKMFYKQAKKANGCCTMCVSVRPRPHNLHVRPACNWQYTRFCHRLHTATTLAR